MKIVSSSQIYIKLKKDLYEYSEGREYRIVYPDEEKLKYIILLKEGKLKLRGTFSKDDAIDLKRNLSLPGIISGEILP